MQELKNDKQKERLLILSCSARKKFILDKIMAWELYDGVAFRVIKKLMRENKMPSNIDIIILSAKYGLIYPNDKITFYEQKMTKQIVHQQFSHNYLTLSNILKQKNYTEIFIWAGKIYLEALSPFALWNHNQTKLVIPEGGIGKKIAQMVQWIC